MGFLFQQLIKQRYCAYESTLPASHCRLDAQQADNVRRIAVKADIRCSAAEVDEWVVCPWSPNDR